MENSWHGTFCFIWAIDDYGAYSKMSVIRNIVGCALCVILNYLLIPVLGIIGSAWVTIITVIVSGYIVNAFIPAYREIFKSQCKSVLWGWKSLYNFRKY